MKLNLATALIALCVVHGTPCISSAGQPADWKLTAILKSDNGTNQCCFINVKEFKTVALKVGESREGLTLVSVDYTNECAIVKVGTNSAALLLPGSDTTPDPITALTTRLNNEVGGMWINGMFPIIHLPAQASTTEVLNEAVKMTGFDEGHIKKYEIVTTRRVRLNDGNMHEYLAVLIDSDLGAKIVLTRYESPITGWWTRFYDVKR